MEEAHPTHDTLVEEIPAPAAEPRRPARVPRWAQVIPFFTSAFFFLSGFFAIFAPLPLLVLNLRHGRKWAFAALLTNAAIVGLAAGAPSLAIYLIFFGTLAVALPEFLRRRKSIEKAAGYSLLMMVLAAGLTVAVYSQARHVNPFKELRQEVSTLVDYVGKTMPPGAQSMSASDLDDWKKSIVTEFPSAIGIFALILIWVNTLLLIRLNPQGIREAVGLSPTFLKSWKAPELLVWPTIVTGFFLLIDFGVVSEVAVNLFKFLMAIYAIQGLSILSFFFDMWSVRGFFRWAGYVVAAFLMMPLLLSLGFFDLWFDFRAKFRQSSA